MDMSDVRAIEKAIEALTSEELAQFRAWFAEFDAAFWDKQIENDAVAGRLDALIAEARADHLNGSTRKL